FGTGFGAGLNSAWFTSPKPHRTLGFDLRVSVTAAMVPDADQIFNVASLSLERLQILDGGSVTPTLFGEDTPGPRVGEFYLNPVSGQTEELYSFRMPEGTGIPIVPTPMAQLTVGLIRDTNLSIRYVPNIAVGEDVDYGVIGFGVQHGLNQWLGSLPVDVSVQFGFTNLHLDLMVDERPIVDFNTENPYPDSFWQNQAFKFQSNAYTANLIVGKQLPIFSVYGGVGFQDSKTTLKAAGNYPILVPVDMNELEPGGPTKKVDAITDPIDIELIGGNKVHAFVGGRIRLAVFAISFNYTRSTYNSYTLGAGISFR
ncbi:MAG: hypothetical protein EA360_08115, partial [Balneolaceae bacterium]